MSTPPPATDVLRANAAFYEAFTRGDIAAMEELWAREVPVTCLHPLAPCLIGRRDVLESWRQILASPPRSGMYADDARVHVVTDDVAIVTCYERDGSNPAHLAATNVFAREHGAWRMVHHQAGPLARPMAPPAPRPLVN